MALTSSDPVADMLTRIRNAIAVNRTEVSLPHSNFKESVARLLVESGFIEATNNSEVDGKKQLIVTINQPGTNARITEIARLSKPGRRMYTSADDIPTVKRGRGIVIVSTSKGLMTGTAAKQARIGGELICKVY